MGRTYAVQLRGRPYLKIEEQAFSTLTRGADSNPARVKAREEVCETGMLIFKYLNISAFR
jgi:hypothetical protein